MLFSSQAWKSELNFIKDEQRFFEDMLNEYSMPVIESQLFGRIKELIEELTESRDDLNDLEVRIDQHTSRLQRLVEKLDEPEEGMLYRQEHKNILKEVDAFSKHYKSVKKEVFEAVKEVLTHQKQRRLLS